MFSELVIAYLFFGGTGAGVLVVLSLLQLIHASEGGLIRSVFSRKRASAGYALAFLFLLFGTFCLLVDLPDPDKGINLFLRPTPTFLSVGGFALAVSMLISVLLAMRYAFSLFRFVDRYIGLVSLIGIVVGVITILYPGGLCMAMVRDEVWHTWLIPILFGLSSLSTATALLAGCAGDWGRSILKHPGQLRLLRADSLLIVLKAFFITCYLAYIVVVLEGFDEMAYLLAGEGFLPFCVGFVLCGIVAAFAIEEYAIRKRRTWAIAALLPLSLIGGYCLRVFVVGLQL